MFNNLCVFGTCENIFGTFRCECDTGYQLDNTGGTRIARHFETPNLTFFVFAGNRCLGNCTDVNECESPQACLYGECINNEGNYTCKCPPNYQLVTAGNACVGKWGQLTRVEEQIVGVVGCAIRRFRKSSKNVFLRVRLEPIDYGKCCIGHRYLQTKGKDAVTRKSKTEAVRNVAITKWGRWCRRLRVAVPWAKRGVLNANRARPWTRKSTRHFVPEERDTGLTRPR